MEKHDWWTCSGQPMPHEKLCKIDISNGMLLRHIEQLWDEIKRLERKIDKIKRINGIDKENDSRLEEN